MGIPANFKQHLPLVFPLERSADDWLFSTGEENAVQLWEHSGTAAY